MSSMLDRARELRAEAERLENLAASGTSQVVRLKVALVTENGLVLSTEDEIDAQVKTGPNGLKIVPLSRAVVTYTGRHKTAAYMGFTYQGLLFHMGMPVDVHKGDDVTLEPIGP